MISSDNSEADLLPSFLYGSNKVQEDRRGTTAVEENRGYEQCKMRNMMKYLEQIKTRL